MLSEKEKALKFDKIVSDRKKYTYRRFIWTTLMVQKATNQNIMVSDHEVDVEIKKREEKK